MHCGFEDPGALGIIRTSNRHWLVLTSYRVLLIPLSKRLILVVNGHNNNYIWLSTKLHRISGLLISELLLLLLLQMASSLISRHNICITFLFLLKTFGNFPSIFVGGFDSSYHLNIFHPKLNLYSHDN